MSCRDMTYNPTSHGIEYLCKPLFIFFPSTIRNAYLSLPEVHMSVFTKGHIKTGDSGSVKIVFPSKHLDFIILWAVGQWILLAFYGSRSKPFSQYTQGTNEEPESANFSRSKAFPDQDQYFKRNFIRVLHIKKLFDSLSRSLFIYIQYISICHSVMIIFSYFKLHGTVSHRPNQNPVMIFLSNKKNCLGIFTDCCTLCKSELWIAEQ